MRKKRLGLKFPDAEEENRAVSMEAERQVGRDQQGHPRDSRLKGIERLYPQGGMNLRDGSQGLDPRGPMA